MYVYISLSSATPLPMPLAIVTVPCRAALTRPGQPSRRVGAELQRVEPVVVDPPVDDVDRPPAVGGVHVDAVAPAEQVAALDELDPHEPGEQGVLEVGGVVHAGGEDHDERVDDAVRCRRAQRGEQP